MYCGKIEDDIKSKSEALHEPSRIVIVVEEDGMKEGMKDNDRVTDDVHVGGNTKAGEEAEQIRSWLEDKADLGKYCDVFINYGYESRVHQSYT